MRFILNFIFFGVLFYAIYLAFPDAFFTMVGWANKIYEFLKDIFIQLTDKIQEMRGQRGEAPTQPSRHALFLLPLWIAVAFKLRD